MRSYTAYAVHKVYNINTAITDGEFCGENECKSHRGQGQGGGRFRCECVLLEQRKKENVTLYTLDI